MPLQIRRGTEAERLAMTIPLAEGELLYVTDDQRLFIGGKASDGTPIIGGIQVTGYNDENAQDAAAALFAAGTHNNITFVYDNSANSISASVDLSDYQDIITADGIRAPVLGANNFELFNSVTNDVTLDSVVASNISPKESGLYNLGSELLTFKDLYLDNSAWIGSAQITASGTAINLPAGTTVNGLPIGAGSGDGVVEGSNYRINIIGEDSNIIVNSENGNITGNLFGNVFGDVYGSVIGDDSTVIVDTLTGTVIANLVGSLFNNQAELIVDIDNKEFFGNLNGNVIGDLTGNVIGDLSGSVFSSTSILLVDSTAGELRTDQLTLGGDKITSNSQFINFGDVETSVNLKIYSDLIGDGSTIPTGSWLELNGNINVSDIDPEDTESPWVDFRISRGSLDNPIAVENNDVLSGLMFFGYDGSDYSRVNTIAVRVKGTVQENIVPGEFLFICQSDNLDESNVMTFTGNQGVLSAPTIKPGVYDDDTARDAFLTSPEEGMMIFNKTLQKFQGYVSDTGIAGGGAPNSTPGWIDLN